MAHNNDNDDKPSISRQNSTINKENDLTVHEQTIAAEAAADKGGVSTCPTDANKQTAEKTTRTAPSRTSSLPTQIVKIGKYNIDVLLNHSRDKFNKRTKDWEIARNDERQHELPRFDWEGRFWFRNSTSI